MPKVIELTVKLTVHRVSCPGVWLCQDGGVSLNLFALGTSYATCVEPPTFPIAFNDVFYLHKRFDGVSCNIGNLCCLLKEETIYCELVQWSGDCASDCVVLAQYLGALSDVLFPPATCRTEGVDLLMRRSKEFPGILSPKIEIRTKLRLDELWSQEPQRQQTRGRTKLLKPCMCSKGERDGTKKKQSCHNPLYHRFYCYKRGRSGSHSPLRMASVSPVLEPAWSLCSLSTQNQRDTQSELRPCPSQFRPVPCSPVPSCAPVPSCGRRPYQVYRMAQPDAWSSAASWGHDSRNAASTDFYSDSDSKYNDDDATVISHFRRGTKQEEKEKERRMEEEQKAVERILLESQYIEQECDKLEQRKKKGIGQHKPRGPCDCEICQRYHELFLKSNADHSNSQLNRLYNKS